MMPMPFAEIPIFDLNGPAFLTFYAVSLAITVVWSFSRSRSVVNRFDRAGYYPQLTDPYEIAYLSAGAPRVAQLAVVRLIQDGQIEWKSGLTGGRLIPRQPKGGTELNGIERRLLDAVNQKGAKGLPAKEACAAILPETRSIEVKLAAAGLRPTAEERRQAGWSAALPLIVLLAIGVIKLGVGIARDKPVLFLVMFLVVTLILALVAGSATRRLTKTGEELLAKLRLGQDRRPAHQADPAEAICRNFALMGPIVLAGIPEFSGMHRELGKQMGGAASGSSSGGCGTFSSGCGGGGSGCGGGGGCGGCGGGGD